MMDFEHSQLASNSIAFAMDKWIEAASIAMEAQRQIQRPFYLIKPKVFPDGNMWCALYGDDLQEGIAGFGETPELAAVDFDKAWLHQKINT